MRTSVSNLLWGCLHLYTNWANESTVKKIEVFSRSPSRGRVVPPLIHVSQVSPRREKHPCDAAVRTPARGVPCKNS